MKRIHLRQIDRTGILQLTEEQPMPPKACAATEEVDMDRLPSLDELAREGARRLIVRAMHAEVAAYLEAFSSERDAQGRALVVRNGYAKPRSVTIGAGTIEFEAPRVNDKRIIDGVRQKFTSGILPPYMRRSAQISEVLPILYLRGLSTGDFRPALTSLLGDRASGLSASSITRMLEDWQREYEEFCQSPIDEEIAYVWVDGIHTRVRLDDDSICLLVVIGVTTQGKKRLLAVCDGYRESTESWSEVLRSLIRRGMKAPRLAVGDGALGFWAALRNVWPKTKGQRCLFHKMSNILDKLPKKSHDSAKIMLKAIFHASTKAQARREAARFEREFAKYEKATKCLMDEFDDLLTFMEFPKQHWKSLRTTNIIESSFATVRLRTRRTKGPGNRQRGIAMAFKLLIMAQGRWRQFDGAKHLAKVMSQSDTGESRAA